MNCATACREAAVARQRHSAGGVGWASRAHVAAGGRAPCSARRLTPLRPAVIATRRSHRPTHSRWGAARALPPVEHRYASGRCAPARRGRARARSQRAQCPAAPAVRGRQEVDLPAPFGQRQGPSRRPRHADGAPAGGAGALGWLAVCWNRSRRREIGAGSRECRGAAGTALASPEKHLVARPSCHCGRCLFSKPSYAHMSVPAGWHSTWGRAIVGLDVCGVHKRTNRPFCVPRRHQMWTGKGQVVMPRGGGGIDSTVLPSSGVQPAGGQSVANTHVTSEPGYAALGAMRPAHPSRQSCSPTR
jgi:hypothetical protein